MNPRSRGQGAFEYVLLMGGILFIATVAFFILRGTSSKQSNQVEFAQCKSQLIAAGACYYANGTWKTDVTTPLDVNSYGISADCTNDAGGGLSGTPWDVIGTNDQFYCGTSAPQ
ncbi:MAG TPA: class III signal peptide-containing protein [Candidatus Norongarragalinales archaeon]|nr:class III signal peptide-containing protein [Candidatus Norongarragalinales archaeon]